MGFMRRRWVIIAGAIVAVVIIVVCVDYFILDEPSPEESPPVERSTAPGETGAQPQLAAPEEVKPATEQPTPSFEEKVENVREAMTDVRDTGEAEEVTLIFTEAEANEQAAKLMGQVEMPEDIPLEIKNVHIDFQPGNNVLTEVETTIPSISLTVDIKVKSRVGVKEGKPTVEVTDISFLGSDLLPQSLKDRINGLVIRETEGLLDQLTQVALGSNVDVEYKEINIQEETASITVVIKPRA